MTEPELRARIFIGDREITDKVVVEAPPIPPLGRVLSAIDLLIDFLTLGQYGIERR